MRAFFSAFDVHLPISTLYDNIAPSQLSIRRLEEEEEEEGQEEKEEATWEDMLAAATVAFLFHRFCSSEPPQQMHRWHLCAFERGPLVAFRRHPLLRHH